MAPSDWSGGLSIQVAPTDVRTSDVASGCDSQPEHPADPAAAGVNIGPQWKACAFYWPWKENIAKNAQKTEACVCSGDFRITEVQRPLVEIHQFF